MFIDIEEHEYFMVTIILCTALYKITNLILKNARNYGILISIKFVGIAPIRFLILPLILGLLMDLWTIDGDL